MFPPTSSFILDDSLLLGERGTCCKDAILPWPLTGRAPLPPSLPPLWWWVHAGGRYFALHRVVLYGRSDYFARLFTSGFKEGREAGGDVMREGADEEGSRSTTTLPTITIDDISADAFAAVVEYMYSDRCRDLEGPLLLEVRADHPPCLPAIYLLVGGRER